MHPFILFFWCFWFPIIISLIIAGRRKKLQNLILNKNREFIGESYRINCSVQDTTKFYNYKLYTGIIFIKNETISLIGYSFSEESFIREYEITDMIQHHDGFLNKYIIINDENLIIKLYSNTIPISNIFNTINNKVNANNSMHLTATAAGALKR